MLGINPTIYADNGTLVIISCAPSPNELPPNSSSGRLLKMSLLFGVFDHKCQPNEFRYTANAKFLHQAATVFLDRFNA